MTIRAAAVVAILTALLACVPRGPSAPIVACPPIAFDRRVPADAQRAAQAAGMRVVPCTNGEYGLVLPGARERSLEELAAWQRRASAALVALDGVNAAGFGGCCAILGGDGGAWFDTRGCVRVYLDQGTPAEKRLAETIAKLRDDDADVRVSVTQSPPRVPRCSANDPACGPRPYEGEGCVDLDATRSWSRRVIGLRETKSACTHDGECGACNAVCTDYVHRPFACTDEYATGLRDAYCGCVDGACRWFELER